MLNFISSTLWKSTLFSQFDILLVSATIAGFLIYLIYSYFPCFYFYFLSVHRGRIRLKSKNVEDHALIIPNYFQHPDDLIPIIESFKFGKKLAAVFEDGSILKSGHFPGCWFPPRAN